MMQRDEIIEGVWRNRDAYVREHHHNLDEIVADLQHQGEGPFGQHRRPSETAGERTLAAVTRSGCEAAAIAYGLRTS